MLCTALWPGRARRSSGRRPTTTTNTQAHPNPTLSFTNATERRQWEAGGELHNNRLSYSYLSLL